MEEGTGGCSQAVGTTEGLNKFAASTERQISPGCLHVSLVVFFACFPHFLRVFPWFSLHVSLVFFACSHFSFLSMSTGSGLPLVSRGLQEAPAVTLSFSPVELTYRTSTRYFASRHQFVLPLCSEPARCELATHQEPCSCSQQAHSPS